MDFLIFLFFVAIFFGKPISKILKRASAQQNQMSGRGSAGPWGNTQTTSDPDADDTDYDYETAYVPIALKKQMSSTAARSHIKNMKAGAWDETQSYTPPQTGTSHSGQSPTGSSRKPVMQDMNRHRVKGLSRHKRGSILEGPELFAVLTLMTLGFYLFTLSGS